jgi:hypothetical protein
MAFSKSVYTEQQLQAMDRDVIRHVSFLEIKPTKLLQSSLTLFYTLALSSATPPDQHTPVVNHHPIESKAGVPGVF